VLTDLSQARQLVDDENGVLLSILIQRYLLELEVAFAFSSKHILVRNAAARFKAGRSSSEILRNNVSHIPISPAVEGRLTNLRKPQPLSPSPSASLVTSVPRPLALHRHHNTEHAEHHHHSTLAPPEDNHATHEHS
jgi:hypothetical protein